MDTVNLLAVEFILGIISFHFLPKFYALSIFSTIILSLGVILRKREFFYWVIPILFLLRIYTATTDIKYEVGEKIDAVVNLYEGRGKIEKIGKNLSYRRDYINIDRLENGRYRVKGTVKKNLDRDHFREYYIKEESSKKIELNPIQKKMLERTESVTKNSSNEERNLYKAVILGIREPLYPRIRELFIKSGLAHILAISGLHLGVVAAVLEFLLKKMKIPRRERSIYLFFAITFYLLGIRFSPSVQRAYLMMTVILMGRVFYENSDSLKSLSLAFLLSITLDPTSYLDLSMVLSYSAMFLISIISPHISRANISIKERLQIGNERVEAGIFAVMNYIIFTLSLQLGMAPIIYLYMGEYSFRSILISILMTPVGIIYIILSFVSLILPIMPLTNLCYNLMIKLMEFLH